MAIPKIKVLAFEHDGVPKMLSSAEEIERAIKRGEIVAETPITLYFEDGDRRFATAAAHPQLAHHFPPQPGPQGPPDIDDMEAADDGDEGDASEEGEDADVDEGGVEGEAREEEADPDEAALVEEPPAPVASARDADETDPDPDPAAATRNALVIAGAVVVAIFALIWLSQLGGRPRSSSENVASVTDVVGNATTTEDVARAAQTYYLAQTAAVRSRATGDSMQLGELARGVEVKGDPVEGSSDASSGWIRLIGGPFPDAFVSQATVRSTPPPAIDESSAGEFRLLRDSNLLDAPNGESRNSIKVGAKVAVAGTVAGFAEVVDPAGGVGYVRWDDINGNPYLSSTYRLKISNRCFTTKRFLLVWHQTGSWQMENNQIFAIDPRTDTTLYRESGFSRIDVIVDRLEIYYYPLSRETNTYREVRATSKNSVIVDGTETKMLTAIPQLTEDGNMTVTFDGTAC